MTSSFTRVSLGMALGIVGVIIAMAFVIHPILFPPEPVPWCCTYNHVEPITINWIAVAILGAAALIALGGTLIATGLSAEEQKEDPRKLCPHFNVDGDGKCNLLPESEDCKGYCRTLGVWRK